LQKLVAEIMAAWRRAERLASTLPPESAEHDAAQRACERLRDAYQELTHSGVAAVLTAAEAKMLLADAASDVDHAEVGEVRWTPTPSSGSTAPG
jgi:hypothetical protein